MSFERESYVRDRVGSKEVELEGGYKVEIRRLSAGGWSELMRTTKENEGDNVLRALTIVKYGCPEFGNDTVEEIGSTLLLEDAMIIANEVMEFSGVNEDTEKNLESGQS